MGRRWDCIHGRKNVHPKQQEAQKKILQENHDSVDMEHSGQQRMLELIK